MNEPSPYINKYVRIAIMAFLIAFTIFGVLFFIFGNRWITPMKTFY